MWTLRWECKFGTDVARELIESRKDIQNQIEEIDMERGEGENH